MERERFRDAVVSTPHYFLFTYHTSLSLFVGQSASSELDLLVCAKIARRQK